MKNSNQLAIDTAKLEWVNTMRRKYPSFNPKLWGRSYSYRMNHPQEALTD